MEITLLLKAIVGLVVILAILIFVLFLPTKKKKAKKVVKKSTSSKASLNTNLEHLRSIIKKKRTTTK